MLSRQRQLTIIDWAPHAPVDIQRHDMKDLMPSPKISVIIPLFDTEKYVHKCLTSVMNQTFRDIEIICVDDCSPDRSVEIVERLAAVDSRIQLIRHSHNLGLGGARNTGIRSARGEYIASVDSDDYVHPTMLQALMDGTRCGKFDVVVCGYDRVNEEGSCLSEHFRIQKTLDPIPDGSDPFLISNPAFWNKLWRKSLYTENGIYFPEKIYYQDAATIPRLYVYARNVNFIGGGYYKYLVRGDSVSNKISDKHLLDKLREIDVIKDFFLSRGLYYRYEDAIRRRIFDTFRQHWLIIATNKSDLDDATLTYLRHMLVLREGMLRGDDPARKLSPAFLKTAFETQDFDLPQAAEKKIINDIIKRGLAFKLFDLLVSGFLDAGARARMRRDPLDFFQGASHPVVKIGRLAHRRYLTRTES